MMFQNSAYGDKWFYAFITSVEYVNDVTSNISFEIDVMQLGYLTVHQIIVLLKENTQKVTR